ncbi:unnamed protein product [Ambrosiozyma monospora]|uniref:Unnamed protein product n=1 Tax=Ambrosiozyma monospora TaxID=43982 RepID=A0ACB5SVH1_AMBMO|nr:unnamed protein product [Ambrosiozyma monospora]
MIEFEKFAPLRGVIVCWFHCILFLPEWHFTVSHVPQNLPQSKAHVFGSGLSTSFNAVTMIREQANNVISTKGMLQTFKSEFLKKVKTAETDKLLEFCAKFKEIGFMKITTNSHESELQNHLNAHDASKDDPPENDSLESSDEEEDSSTKDPLKEGIFLTWPKDPSIIKTFELKSPYIHSDVDNDQIVKTSQEFYRELIPHCLVSNSLMPDLLDFTNYYVFKFDLKIFYDGSGANGRSLFFNFDKMEDGPSLLCCMCASTFYNIHYHQEIQGINLEDLKDSVLRKGCGFISFPELGQGDFDNNVEKCHEDFNMSSSVGSRSPIMALTPLNSDKLPSTIEGSQMYHGTCRELQESQGEHASMVLAITYKTAIMYFGHSSNWNNLNINEDEEVTLKILDLLHIEEWFKMNRFFDQEERDKALNELRENIKNEIKVYEHIWNFNNSLKNDSESFIHIPQLIHYGEVSEDLLQSLDVTSGTSWIDKGLEASGGLNIRYLKGPYLVFEYLKSMRPPRDDQEYAEVQKELAKLKKIGVSYVRNHNFFFDPKTKKAYIFDFKRAQLRTKK